MAELRSTMIWSLASTPDGSELAVAHEDGRLEIVDGATLAPLRCHSMGSAVRAVVWTPQGWLAGLADGRISGAMGVPDHDLSEFGAILSLAATPDGRVLVAGTSGGFVLRIEGDQLAARPASRDAIQAVAIGDVIAALDFFGTTHLLRAGDLLPDRTIPPAGRPPIGHAVGWGPTGTLVIGLRGTLRATRPDGSVLWQDTNDLAQIGYKALAWSRGGRLAAVLGTERTLRDPATGAVIASSRWQHPKPISAIAWAGETVVTACEAGKLTRWEIPASGAAPDPAPARRGRVPAAPPPPPPKPK